MKTFAIVCLIPLMFGCSLLDQQTPAQRAVLVKSLARTATVAALSQVDDNRRVTYAQVLVLGSTDLVAALESILEGQTIYRDEVTLDLVHRMFASLNFADDPILQELAQTTLELVLVNLNLDGLEDELVDSIGEDNIRLVISVVQGIRQGASRFISTVDPTE